MFQQICERTALDTVKYSWYYDHDYYYYYDNNFTNVCFVLVLIRSQCITVPLTVSLLSFLSFIFLFCLTTFDILTFHDCLHCTKLYIFCLSLLIYQKVQRCQRVFVQTQTDWWRANTTMIWDLRLLSPEGAVEGDIWAEWWPQPAFFIWANQRQSESVRRYC